MRGGCCLLRCRLLTAGASFTAVGVLGTRASVAVACWLGSRGEWAELPGRLWNLSLRIRDRNCVPSIGKQILNHWATRKSPRFPLNTEFGQIIPKSWDLFSPPCDLSSLIRDPTRASAVTADSPNHWTTRKRSPELLYRLRHDGLGAKACVLPLENLSLPGCKPSAGLPQACRPHCARLARPPVRPALARRASHTGLPAAPWTRQGHTHLRSVCLPSSLRGTLSAHLPVAVVFSFRSQLKCRLLRKAMRMSPTPSHLVTTHLNFPHRIVHGSHPA